MLPIFSLVSLLTYFMLTFYTQVDWQQRPAWARLAAVDQYTIQSLYHVIKGCKIYYLKKFKCLAPNNCKVLTNSISGDICKS